MRLLNQRVEILERAEQPVDLAVVGDVVAHVVLRRLGNGREPDAVDAEALDVVEAADDAREVAYPVTIGVLKGPGIDLIDHPTAPPLGHRHSPAETRRTLPVRGRRGNLRRLIVRSASGG